MRIVVYAPLYPPAWRGGGPVRSVHAVVTVAQTHHDVTVVTRDRDLDSDERLDVGDGIWHEVDEVNVAYADLSRPLGFVALVRRLHHQRPDLLYFNSFFDFWLSILPQTLSLVSRPSKRSRRMVAPRGEFGDAALQIKSRKKRLFVNVYKLLRLHRGVIWHASSVREADEIRREMGVSASVIVRQNDTLLPAPVAARPEADRSHEDRPLRAVFVGRLVPIKGIDTLIRALCLIDVPVEVSLYGPEEDAAFARLCRSLAQGVRAPASVAFRGPLAPAQVRETIAGHDLLLMPTLGENFGQVIAEALSCSVPVMAMDTTPWTETLASGGGVVVNGTSPATWSCAIADYAGAGKGEWEQRRRTAALIYRNWYETRPPADLFTQLAAACPRASANGGLRQY